MIYRQCLLIILFRVMVRFCLDAVGRTESNPLLRCNGGHADSCSRRTDIVVWFSIVEKMTRTEYSFHLDYDSMGFNGFHLSETVRTDRLQFKNAFFLLTVLHERFLRLFSGQSEYAFWRFSPFNYVQECKGGHFRPLVLTLGCSPSPVALPCCRLLSL